MIDKELEKKAENYAEEQEKHCILGVYDDTSDLEYDKGYNEGYINGLEEGYIAGAKELENEYMLKLKDTSFVRALKDSIIMNEKLSSCVLG